MFTGLSPFLKPPRHNPHATLITLFLNAVVEIFKTGNEKDTIPDMDVLTKYLPTPDIFSLLSPHSADLLRTWDARNLALDVDTYFQK